MKNLLPFDSFEYEQNDNAFFGSMDMYDDVSNQDLMDLQSAYDYKTPQRYGNFGLAESMDEWVAHRKRFETMQKRWEENQRKEQERNETAQMMRDIEKRNYFLNASQNIAGGMMNVGQTMQQMSLQTDVFGWRI